MMSVCVLASLTPISHGFSLNLALSHPPSLPPSLPPFLPPALPHPSPSPFTQELMAATSQETTQKHSDPTNS